MQRNLTHFARKGRQFKRLSKEINRLLDSGRFYQLADEKQRSLASRLRALYRRLTRVIPARRLRLGLGAAAMLLGLGLTQPLQAQNFGPPVPTPFNFSNITYFSLPSFADIDADGDLDLFTTGYVDGESYYLTLRYFQNVGDAENPDFSAPVDAPFGITEQNILNVSFVDIDDDGDLDAFLPQAYGSFLFRENTGTAQSPVFGAAQPNPFGLTPLSYFPFASFVDIDGDGDLDMISTEFYGVTYFFENTGTAAAPAFTAPVSDPFGILPPAASILRTIAFSDVDLDGDKDLMYFDFNGDFENSAIFYSENTGTAMAPAFAAGIQGPSGIFFSGYSISSPSFADTDADGDEDLFMGTYQSYGGLVYFENLAITNALPTTADAEVTTMEDVPYTFSANDFPFNDPDAGDALESIKITVLTSVGSLTWDGNPVVADQEIAAADIGLLVFTPNPDEFGDNYDSFTFQVSDGEAYGPDSAVMTIDVQENVATTENTLNVNALLSPNPAGETVRLELAFQSAPGALTISIVDALGKVHNTWTGDADREEFQTTLDVAGLTPGMYFVHLRSGDRFTTLRFVKD